MKGKGKEGNTNTQETGGLNLNLVLLNQKTLSINRKKFTHVFYSYHLRHTSFL